MELHRIAPITDGFLTCFRDHGIPSTCRGKILGLKNFSHALLGIFRMKPKGIRIVVNRYFYSPKEVYTSNLRGLLEIHCYMLYSVFPVCDILIFTWICFRNQSPE